MKKIILTLFLSSFIYSCTSNDNLSNTISLEGAIFTRSSYVLETPVDGNNDGVFSNDLMEENFCFDLNLRFNAQTTSSIPTNDVFLLNVVDDGNGNLIQQMNCAHGDGPGMDYTIEDNVVSFSRNDEFMYSGVISADGNTITINFDSEDLFAFTLWFNPENEILNPDGTITNYVGSAVVTYTRQ